MESRLHEYEYDLIRIMNMIFKIDTYMIYELLVSWCIPPLIYKISLSHTHFLMDIIIRK